MTVWNCHTNPNRPKKVFSLRDEEYRRLINRKSVLKDKREELMMVAVRFLGQQAMEQESSVCYQNKRERKEKQRELVCSIILQAPVYKSLNVAPVVRD